MIVEGSTHNRHVDRTSPRNHGPRTGCPPLSLSPHPPQHNLYSEVLFKICKMALGYGEQHAHDTMIIQVLMNTNSTTDISKLK